MHTQKPIFLSLSLNFVHVRTWCIFSLELVFFVRWWWWYLVCDSVHKSFHCFYLQFCTCFFTIVFVDLVFIVATRTYALCHAMMIAVLSSTLRCLFPCCPFNCDEFNSYISRWHLKYGIVFQRNNNARHYLMKQTKTSRRWWNSDNKRLWII